jgi:predicted transcriptional regulator
MQPTGDVYNLRIPDDLKQSLREISEREDRTLPQVIRRALRLYVTDYRDGDAWVTEAMRMDGARAATTRALAKRHPAGGKK